MRMRRVIVVLAAGAVVATVTAGAAIGRPSKSSGPKIDTNATLTFATLATTPTLDPQVITNSPQLTHNLYDRLTTLDGHANVKPMIALSWQTSKDAKSITFKLRKGVKFHDGTPLDATAVKASLDRARTPPRGTVPLLTDIDSVDVVDPYTIRVNLKFGGAELPTIFASSAGSIINPKCIAANTDLTQMPDQCTSGAWTFVSGTPPTEWHFTKWTGKYWDPKAFKYAKLNWIEIPTSSGIMNALLAGDADIGQVTTEGIPQFRSLKASGQLRGKIFSGPSLDVLMFNTRKPPFDNELLRKAVQAGIDARAIGNQYFAGNCPPTQQPAIGLAADPKWNPNPYNPDKAKQYLAQAGYPNGGFSFTDTVPNIALTVGTSQVIQDQLAKVGIKMDIAPVVGSTAPPLVQGIATSSVTSVGNALDPSGAVSTLFNLADGRLAPALGSNVEQQVQTLRFHAVDPTLTAVKRGKVYQQIWKVAYDHALYVSVCRLGLAWAYRSNILNADYIPFVTPISFGNDMRYIAIASK
jgi:peptide/nickel transport system substrate-binding protein